MHLLSALLIAPPALAQEDEGSGPVGGALAGWGAVPIADENERTGGTTHLWGQLQTWVTVWDQDADPQADPATYGDPEADPGFTLARAGLGIDGFIPMGDLQGASQIDYALSVGVGSPYDVLTPRIPDVQIVDAFGRWALPTGLGVTSLALGVQRIPFTREALMSSAHLVFQERSVTAAWLAPGREAGAILGQSLTFSDATDGPQLLLRLGAFNGNEDIFGDTDPGLLASGRLELIVGDTYRTWSAAKEPALGVGVAGMVDDELATTTTSLGADLIARYSLVTVMGEVVSSRVALGETDVVDPGLVDGVSRLGWLGQLSVYLPFDDDQGVELAGRFATFDDDVDIDNAGDVGILHAGATWRSPLPRLDVGVGFIHRMETDEVANDTIRIWTQVRPEGRF